MPTLIAFATGQLVAGLCILIVLASPLLILLLGLSVRRQLIRIANAAETFARSADDYVDADALTDALKERRAERAIPLSQFGR